MFSVSHYIIILSNVLCLIFDLFSEHGHGCFVGFSTKNYSGYLFPNFDKILQLVFNKLMYRREAKKVDKWNCNGKSCVVSNGFIVI